MAQVPQLVQQPESGQPPLPAGSRGSEYAALSRQVRQAGLLDRRLRYYAWKIALTAVALAAGWAAFAVIGNSWWQLARRGVPGRDLRPVRLPRPRRRAPAGLPLPAGQLRPRHAVRQSGHRAQLRLVDRQAQPAPRPPEHRGRRPGHHDRRAGVLRRPGAGRPGHPAAGLPLPGLPARSRCCSSRRSACTSSSIRRDDAAGPAGTGPGRRRCSACTSPAISPRCSSSCRRSRPWSSSSCSRACSAFYLGCSFAPNHKGMPILAADDKTDFLRRQVLTSRNVRGGWLTDFALGGLNYQIEHHLFPSMPRPSLRRSQPLIAAFCAERGRAVLPDHPARVVRPGAAPPQRHRQAGARRQPGSPR